MEPSILRETKFGEKGFVKEDVFTYFEELQQKNENLEKQLKELSGQKPAEPQELVKYRNQVDNLQEKLNASNNALRAAKKENEELQQEIAKLKSGKPSAAPAANGAATVENPQTKAALDAAKREIDKLRSQLKSATEKPAATANPQTTAALEAAKKEIDNLRAKLKAAEQKAASTPSNANNNNADLAKAQQEVTKITAELNAKTEELKAKTAELEAANKTNSEKDNKIQQLIKENEAVAKKDEEIAQLNSEITRLKETSNDPAAIMGSLFAEAQKNISQLKADEAKKAADATREATEKAEKVVKEANEMAEKTIREANDAAEKTIKEANEQAKNAVDDANSKAGKINEMSATVRNMLLKEIESVHAKFSDLTSAINKLTDEAADRMDEAQSIIGEARKAVEPNDSNTVKLAEAPKADFSAAKAPVASTPRMDKAEDKDASKNINTNDPFAAISGGSYNKGSVSDLSSSKPMTSHHTQPSPAQEAPKPAPKKTVSNFNFDMSDLLKAAEEEAAKEQ